MKNLNEKVKKVFHVSPFFQIEGEYEFNTKILNKSIKVEIKYYKKDKTNLLNAIFYGEQSELNDKNLLLCFFAYPLMTIKVIYSIHLHALYLWIKGIKFFNRPNPSKDIISFSKTLIKDNCSIVLAYTTDKKKKSKNLHPTFGLWDVSLRNDLRKSLNSGIRKMLAWTAKHNVSYCKFSESKFNPFFNINNPDDLIEAEDIIEKGWV